MTERIHIPAGKPYDVLIGRGLLAEAGRQVREACPKAEKAFVVTDDRVAELYGESVIETLRAEGLRTERLAFAHGEASKTVETWARVMEAMCAARMTRSDVLVTLGGGVTGDLGGFAAACYQRGIDYVQIPTTLLAMVDSSVGGKTAVDLAGGKNQAGAFWQPKRVICDPDTLGTLPEEEYRCGCAEIIKYAMIGSAEFFASLEKTPVRDQAEQVIAECVRMKRDYVQADEFDLGQRMMLNFGHTFGHACEALSRFSILHGQGVAMGMSLMARAAAARGILAEEDKDALIGLIRKYGLPTEAGWTAAEMAEACRADKKAAGSSIRIVVPEKIGKCRIQTVKTEELETWLRQGGAA